MAKDIYGLPSTGGDPRANKIRTNAMKRLAQVKRDEELRINKLREEYKYLVFLQSKGALSDKQKLRLEYLWSVTA
jgi:hypothetical protein